MTHAEKLQELAKLITEQRLAELNRLYPGGVDWTKEATARVKPGAKYTKIDVGSSGKYMVDAEGNIYGIKAYGVIHRGHRYGTLDTIHDYFWGGYTAVKKPVVKKCS